MNSLLQTLLLGHVQLTKDSIQRNQRRLKAGYEKYIKEKQNPYAKQHEYHKSDLNIVENLCDIILPVKK